MSDAEEISALLEDMRSGVESRLISASTMLAVIGADAVPGLLETLESSHAITRDYSAMALGKIQPPAECVLPALCKAAFDTSANVRYAAVAAIHGIGKASPLVMSCLQTLKNDPDKMTRDRAQRAIAEFQI